MLDGVRGLSLRGNVYEILQEKGETKMKKLFAQLLLVATFNTIGVVPSAWSSEIGVTDDSILFGCIFDTTGPGAFYGNLSMSQTTTSLLRP